MGASAANEQDVHAAMCHGPRLGSVAIGGKCDESVRIEQLLILSGHVSFAKSHSLLVDGGATSNFASQDFALRHQLEARMIPSPLLVHLADGSQLTCKSMLSGVEVSIGEYRGSHDFLLLPQLDPFDAVLGRPFLIDTNARVDHARGVVSFGGSRKARVAKPTGDAAVFAVSIHELIDGQNEVDSALTLRACGLMATSLACDTVDDRPAPLLSTVDLVNAALAQYESAVAPFVGKLPPSRGDFDHSITLRDPAVRPRSRKAIPLRERHLRSLAKHLTELLDAGLIRPSRSPWGSPVFFVPKNETDDRMVCDYRSLNEVTESNNSSLPFAKELFGRLGKAVIFSKLDLTSGYHQLRLRTSDIPLTAFTTPLGHFEWLVMPFGEKNAPASFHQLMSQLVFPDFIHDFLIVFQDDMLIASCSEEEHVTHVKLVLDRLAQHQLWIKPSKCEWAVREVEFLGHTIRSTENGTVLQPCESKLKAIEEWPVPATRSELNAFLGLANYYRQFINGFSQIAACLTTLTAPRAPFAWRNDHQIAFDSLKTALVTAPALLSHDDAKPYVMHVDASSFAVGAVLSQHDDAGVMRPIAFYTHKLTDTQLRWDVYEREIYSVVAALQHWSFHLKGAKVPVSIFTDHQSLQELRQQLLRPKMSRWLTVLNEFNYTVTWIPGDLNAAADALSRRPDHDAGSVHRRLAQTMVARDAHIESGNSLGPGTPPTPEQLLLARPATIARSSNRDVAQHLLPSQPPCSALPSVQLTASLSPRDRSQESPPPAPEQSAQISSIAVDLAPVMHASVSSDLAPASLIDTIRGCYALDPACSEILADPARNGYRLADGILYRHGDRGILVPDSVHQATNLRASIIYEAHSTVISGHMGVAKTVNRIREVYYWPGLSRDVADFVAACDSCQRNKSSNQSPAGLLKPIESTGKGKIITLDFVGPLPRSKRQHDYMLVVVDKATKRAYYEPCRSTITAKQTADLVFRRVVREQGFPERIITDRDPRFASAMWRSLWQSCGTKLGLATSYHQQTDGQSERQIRTLEETLRSFVNSTGSDWDERLPFVEYAHNTAVHMSTGFTPMQLHSGIVGRTPLALSAPSVGEDVARSKWVPLEIIRQMETDMVAAQDALKLAQQRQKRNYDLHHRDVTFAPGDFAFLSTADRIARNPGLTIFRPLWEGPYEVLQVSADRLNVTLDLPEHLDIHPVFHVSKLKKAHPSLGRQQSVPQLVRSTGSSVPDETMLATQVDASEEQRDLVGLDQSSDSPAVLVSQSDAQLHDQSDHDEVFAELAAEDDVADGPRVSSDDEMVDLSLPQDIELNENVGRHEHLRRSGRVSRPPSRLIHSGRLGDQWNLALRENLHESDNQRQ